MKYLVLVWIGSFYVHMAVAQFTEPTEIPNGLNVTDFANVIAAKATESEEGWTLSVTLESPDTGCDQYADWWEIMDLNGQLIYRRILTHSHVDEQPFTRAGGPVLIEKNQVIWIRAHMNNTGYGGQTLKGSPAKGFKPTKLPETLGQNLSSQQPLPDGCRF